MRAQHDVVQIKRAFKKMTLGLTPDQARVIFDTLRPDKYTENVNGVFLDLNDVPEDRLLQAYQRGMQFVDQDQRQEAYADQVRVDRCTKTNELKQSIKKQAPKTVIGMAPDVSDDPEPTAKPTVYNKVQERLLKRCRELRPPGRNRHLLRSIVEVEDDKPASAFDENDEGAGSDEDQDEEAPAFIETSDVEDQGEEADDEPDSDTALEDDI